MLCVCVGFRKIMKDTVKGISESLVPVWLKTRGRGSVTDDVCSVLAKGDIRFVHHEMPLPAKNVRSDESITDDSLAAAASNGCRRPSTRILAKLSRTAWLLSVEYC